MTDAATMNDLADALAFTGNSLLKPMTQTATVGLDPAFWDAFPSLGSEAVAAAAAACGARAAAFAARAEAAGKDAVERCAVEYTKLFVGPPKPAVAPWETMYREGGADAVGFGQATVEMRALLREAGLELHNENRQYEDHMGIELLYLSELCRRAAAGEAEAGAASAFVDEHPLSWVEAFRTAVAEAAPEGYFDTLLGLVRELLLRTKELCA